MTSRPKMAWTPSATRRFIREAQATASVKHDHIVDIYQVGEDRGTPFLAMELLQGEALDERIKREGKLPIAEVLRIGRETAEGLAAAHEKGLIHRDIKPQNLWLEKRRASERKPDVTGIRSQGAGVRSQESEAGGRRSGTGNQGPRANDQGLMTDDFFRVKILDFGLARASDDDTHLTASGAILGTPAYMAPEQASGDKIDHRCDLFSLGCVLYRLCTGELPFKGANTMAIVLALAQDHPRPPRKINPEVPPAFSDLIMKLLEKKKEKRPATAQAVVEAIQAIEVVQTQVRTSRSTSPEKKAGEKTAAKVARSLLKAVANVLFSIVWLFRIPGRAGLALKGAGGALLLGLILTIVWPKHSSKPDGTGSNPANTASSPSKTVDLEKQTEKHLVNSIGMKLVLIPAGTFRMGTSGAGAPEGPAHDVVITKPFHMGKYEVTQAQLEKVMGANNPAFTKDQGGGPNHAAEKVTWYIAMEFCAAMTALPAEKQAGRFYRLPTEAEWEYAARAGSKRAYSFGDDPQLLGQYGWFRGNAGGKPHPVGLLLPNAWGLCDMYGNVWEWCSDYYAEKYYENNTKDPQGAQSGDRRVLRGGSADNVEEHCRSAFRSQNRPGDRLTNVGFRVVCVVAAGTP